MFFRGLQGLKNYQGPANVLINILFGGIPFSPSTTTLPPAITNNEGNLVIYLILMYLQFNFNHLS